MSSATATGLPVTFASEVTDTERKQGLDALAALRVRTKSPVGKYVRADLSVSWAKFAGVGLDMKDYIFARHLSDVIYDPDGFTVRSGVLTSDPYTGLPVKFRQEDDPAKWQIEIDHIVSLKDAWDSGGHAWSPAGRNWQQIANDPGNLLPTARAVNTKKSDHPAHEWLPPVDAFRARFVILQVAVKTRFRLSVTEAEAARMREVLTG
jgi:hypothetical protein